MKESTFHTEYESHDGRNPNCEYCRLMKPFKMPEEIIDALVKDNLVIFAGAGVSTENREAIPITLYEQILAELKLTGKQKPSFAKLMTLYCAKKNGRRKLIQRIQQRIDYVRSFPVKYFPIARFYRGLSTIPYVMNIVTTNWDDFFEKECQASPIVEGKDFAAFSEISQRRVFKIHGSINSIGSLVVTEKNYDKCYRELRSGAVGTVLRMFLMSKTVLFVGYSFGDKDFERIYDLLIKEVGEYIPQAYIVTLDPDAKRKVSRFGGGVTPITTDAAYFIEVLKEHLAKKNLIVPDDRFDGIDEALNDIRIKNDELWSFRLIEHPSLIYCSTYQDGFRDGLVYVRNRKSSGQVSDPNAINEIVKHIEHGRFHLKQLKMFPGVSYMDGFTQGVNYLLKGDKARERVPRYYIYGFDGGVHSLKELFDLEPKNINTKNEEYSIIKEIVKKQEGGTTPITIPPPLQFFVDFDIPL